MANNNNYQEVAKMLNVADTYRDIAYKLNADADKRFLMPSQVNAALSLEIYLKAIYRYETTGRTIRTHSLNAIFKQLKQKTKHTLTSSFFISETDEFNISKLENEMKKHDSSHVIRRDWNSLLKEWGKVFTDARYWYELDKKKLDMVLFPNIVEHLNSYINNEIRPNL